MIRIRNTGRKRKTISLSEHYDLPDEGAEPINEYPVSETELKDSLLKLAQQKASFYEVLHLHVFESMTFDKIAEVLNKNRNTVSSQYRYAVHYLKKLLQQFINSEVKEG